MALNPNAQKWVEALRSGEFTQTQNYLFDGNGYCCLGVACVLHARETGNEGFILTEAEFEDENTYMYLGANELLPDEVREWLGLATENGKYDGSDLTTDNDSNDATFDDIAGIIECEPEGLFS